MGNLGKGSRPTQKTVARKILTSGEEYNGSGSNDKFLTIKLIRLNLAIVERVTVNEYIEVIWINDGFYCVVDDETIGKVPENYISFLDSSMSYSGSIIELLQTPATVKIKIAI